MQLGEITTPAVNFDLSFMKMGEGPHGPLWLALTVALRDRLRIFEMRRQMVVLDSDLATIYGVQTKVFNQAIRRNSERIPDDFLFRLSTDEWTVLRSQIVTSSSHGGRRHPPLVFTEHGAIMAATVLNSPRAVAMSVC